jgi:hypothetical protein
MGYKDKDLRSRSCLIFYPRRSRLMGVIGIERIVSRSNQMESVGVFKEIGSAGRRFAGHATGVRGKHEAVW